MGSHSGFSIPPPPPPSSPSLSPVLRPPLPLLYHKPSPANRPPLLSFNQSSPSITHHQHHLHSRVSIQIELLQLLLFFWAFEAARCLLLNIITFLVRWLVAAAVAAVGRLSARRCKLRGSIFTGFYPVQASYLLSSSPSSLCVAALLLNIIHFLLSTTYCFGGTVTDIT